eukprot:TRINITY_DN3826_c2_g1_i10.p2 TRINITY_DN3826_c2_g1~~TRINITY_DN3826_c2_g1_i10.p2  ORF type:complete len:266 (-),score=-29.89 TRINITY_DN3826_c2_g1_i10:330-1127(-)
MHLQMYVLYTHLYLSWLYRPINILPYFFFPTKIVILRQSQAQVVSYQQSSSLRYEQLSVKSLFFTIFTLQRQQIQQFQTKKVQCTNIQISPFIAKLAKKSPLSFKQQETHENMYVIFLNFQCVVIRQQQIKIQGLVQGSEQNTNMHLHIQRQTQNAYLYAMQKKINAQIYICLCVRVYIRVIQMGAIQRTLDSTNKFPSYRKSKKGKINFMLPTMKCEYIVGKNTKIYSLQTPFNIFKGHYAIIYYNITKDLLHMYQNMSYARAM